VITVRYSSIDGYSEKRKFKTLAGARAYAQKWVGKNPEMGSTYAVSSDGIGKITATVALWSLFEDDEKPGGPPEGEFKIYTVEPYGTKYFTTREEAEADLKAMRECAPEISWGIQEHTVTKEDLGG